MKTKIFIQLILAAIASGFIFYQCTHDDEINPGNGDGTVIGDALIDTEGTVWRFDKAHSNVEWETAYLGELGLLTGRFQDFGISLLFDEKNPDNSTIEAWVTITSNTTGEPGRDVKRADGGGGCMPTDLGVEWPILNPDPLLLDIDNPVPDTNIATFSSTDISRFGGDQYLAKGFLEFRGIKGPVELIFGFSGVIDRSDAQDQSDLRASFTGELPFLAKSIYGVESGSIADEVNIKINCQTRLR